MCMVSVIGDNFKTALPDYHWPGISPSHHPEISRSEFESLKNEVIELRKLLVAAKAYDSATGQRDCEMGEKVELLRKVAKAVGVDLDDVLKEKS